MSETKAVKGYKVFNPDWTCKGKQYTCPGKFEEDVTLSVCNKGMHFCKKAADCFIYYAFDPKNKVAEVIAYGDVLEEKNKCRTNKLEIVREIPWAELLELVNTGNGCTGLGNSGNRNSGDWNSGSWNSGNCNSGNRNSGNRNSGDWNSGSWNQCDYSSGCFNTKIQKIYLFNKPSDWTYKDWLFSKARNILCNLPMNTLEYMRFSDMTDEEKAAHPEAETTDGYLKETDKSKCAQQWWNELADEQKTIITAIPNFDKAIFKEITGIDVDAD